MTSILANGNNAHIYRIEQINNLSQITQVNLKQIRSASGRNKYAEYRIYHEMHFSLTPQERIQMENHDHKSFPFRVSPDYDPIS